MSPAAEPECAIVNVWVISVPPFIFTVITALAVFIAPLITEVTLVKVPAFGATIKHELAVEISSNSTLRIYVFNL